MSVKDMLVKLREKAMPKSPAKTPKLSPNVSSTSPNRSQEQLDPSDPKLEGEEYVNKREREESRGNGLKLMLSNVERPTE